MMPPCHSHFAALAGNQHRGSAIVGKPAGYEWAYVYQNLLSVQETLTWLQDHGSITIPRDSRTLVESTTHPAYLASLAEKRGGVWETLYQRLYGRNITQRQAGEAGVIDWTRPYEDALVDDYLPTRLGEAKITVAVANNNSLQSPIEGKSIDAIPVPSRWLRGVKPETTADVISFNNGVYQLHVGTVHLLYSRLGLQRVCGDEINS